MVKASRMENMIIESAAAMPSTPEAEGQLVELGDQDVGVFAGPPWVITQMIGNELNT